MSVRFAGSVGLSLMVGLASPALAEPAVQLYAVAGSDSFRSAGDLHSTITYAGNQRLTLTHTGNATTFAATVTYTRDDGKTAKRADGSFSTTVMPDGEQRDGPNRDPDYLTVLNQPFAVQLDAATMRDLRGLRGEVPFDFPSPMTGAPLHGVLRRLTDGMLRGERVLGIAFFATGPLNGALPDRPAVALTGGIRMNGTAYYAYGSALLLALDATLAIDGKLEDASAHDPVTIVYRRTIRPLP
jgi:hypothetical protein